MKQNAGTTWDSEMQQNVLELLRSTTKTAEQTRGEREALPRGARWSGAGRSEREMPPARWWRDPSRTLPPMPWKTARTGLHTPSLYEPAAPHP